MYNMPYFKEKDDAVIKQFMQQNPFVILSGCDADHRPVATQVPLLMEERDEKLYLLGHIQRKTNHQLAFAQNANVMAIFTGPHTYVSASWYSDQQTASTWNYITVQASGILQFLDDEALLKMLTRLTAHFENDSHSPSLVEKMPTDYVQKLMKAIVAFEIEVTNIENVFKLSQNRDEKTYHSIISHLETGDEAQKKVANEMKRNLDLHD